MCPTELRVYDDVLPASTFLGLRETMSLWSGEGGTFWLDAGAPPKNLVEATIVALRGALEIGDWLVGAEWWLRRERVSRSKKMHFDKDEALWQKSHCVHPPIASVFYLTEVGGHTLITDQRCSDARTPTPSAPRERWVVAPRENRYLVFDGGLYHGVLPGRSEERALRMTLLLNWWNRPLSDVDRRRAAAAALSLPPRRMPVVVPPLCLSPAAVRRGAVASRAPLARTGERTDL